MSRAHVISIVMTGCSWMPHRDSDPPPPVPPSTPVAIAGINSPFDDFNAASQAGIYSDRIVFSTNRGSAGANFDLYTSTITWMRSDGGPRSLVARDVVPFEPALMSDGDERGPIFLQPSTAPIGSRSRFVFASTRAGGEGGLDLYAAEQDAPGGERGFHALVGINTAGDDAYLTYSPVGNQMLLASNATPGAPLDIYAATWRDKDTIDNVPDTRAIVEALSSDADDTAPFVYWLDEDHREAEIVFASSRGGGLGEHALYCSRFADPRTEAERADEAKRAKIRGWAQDSRRWSPPVLLRELSSPRDEYRPRVFSRLGARYLVFSSTRDGGQGGYDLYVVGYAGCPRA